ALSGQPLSARVRDIGITAWPSGFGVQADAPVKFHDDTRPPAWDREFERMFAPWAGALAAALAPLELATARIAFDGAVLADEIFASADDAEVGPALRRAACAAILRSLQDPP